MRFNPTFEYNIDALQQMIQAGEGVQLDFKQTITNQKKIARTLAAFANNRGGKLLVGVRDNGAIIGCDTEEEMYMLHEAAEHFCEPPVDIAFTIYEVEDELTVLEASVNNSLRKPHFALDEQDDWQLYMRSKDKTLIASKNTYKVLENDLTDSNAKLDSKEQFVLDFLEKKEALMPKELSNRLNISLQRANTILIKLTNIGLILQQKDERGYYYILR